MKGVRPATSPVLASVCLDTVGRLTVKSLPCGVTMSQVLSVTKPLIVIVPSAAKALETPKTATDAAKKSFSYQVSYTNKND